MEAAERAVKWAKAYVIVVNSLYIHLDNGNKENNNQR